MAKIDLRKGILALIIFASGVSAQDVAELVRAGKTKAELKQFRAAIGPLNRALTADPSNVEALRWRGHCRNALGMHSDALADYDKAIQIDPKNAWAWYARGMAKHHLNRAEAAIEDYSKALELDPANHKAIEWRGFNRSQMGDHLGAYVDFTNAMKLDPENPWVFHARGRAAVSLGAYDRGRDDFESAVLLDAKSKDSHAQLGFLFVAMRDDKRALASLDKAFDLDPKRQDYVRLWRYWLRGKVGKLGVHARDQMPVKGWAGDLAKVLLGEITRSKLLLRLSAYNVSPKELPARRCEAEFYLGVRASMTGRPNRAREYFKEALAFGNATMPEWRAARRLARR